jgi:hypothetical protein
MACCFLAAIIIAHVLDFRDWWRRAVRRLLWFKAIPAQAPWYTGSSYKDPAPRAKRRPLAYAKVALLAALVVELVLVATGGVGGLKHLNWNQVRAALSVQAPEQR